MPKFPWSTFIVAVAIGIISWQSLAHPDLLDALWYSRAGVSEGELWRLIGGHFVHHSEVHLLSNLLAFVILAALIESRRGGRYLVNFTLFSALFVSLGMYWGVPGIEFYAGISAVNYGMLAWLALNSDVFDLIALPNKGFSNRPPITAVVVITLLLLHIGYQGWQNSSLMSPGFEDPLILVAWQAHLISIFFSIVFHFLTKPISTNKLAAYYE